MLFENKLFSLVHWQYFAIFCAYLFVLPCNYNKSNSLNYKYIEEQKQIDNRNKKESE